MRQVRGVEPTRELAAQVAETLRGWLTARLRASFITACTGLVAAMLLLLTIGHTQPGLVLAVVVWGVAFGAANLCQISLTLSAGSAEARSAHVRAFVQALRTLRPLTLEELGTALPPPEQVIMQLVVDAGVADAGTVVPADAGPGATATFESAPAPKVNPVGPCAKQ